MVSVFLSRFFVCFAMDTFVLDYTFPPHLPSVLRLGLRHPVLRHHLSLVLPTLSRVLDVFRRYLCFPSPFVLLTSTCA